MSVSDEELMKLLQAGDSSALEELYHRHSDRVWSYIHKRLPLADAEDLYQDFFLKLAGRNSSWNGSPFVLWLYVVLRNMVLDRSRRVKVIETYQRRIQTETSDELSLDFEELIAELPESSKELLRKHFREGESYKELSASMEESETSLRKRLSRALAVLRQGDKI